MSTKRGKIGQKNRWKGAKATMYEMKGTNLRWHLEEKSNTRAKIINWIVAEIIFFLLLMVECEKKSSCVKIGSESFIRKNGWISDKKGDRIRYSSPRLLLGLYLWKGERWFGDLVKIEGLWIENHRRLKRSPDRNEEKT